VFVGYHIVRSIFAPRKNSAAVLLAHDATVSVAKIAGEHRYDGTPLRNEAGKGPVGFDTRCPKPRNDHGPDDADKQHRHDQSPLPQVTHSTSIPAARSTRRSIRRVSSKVVERIVMSAGENAESGHAAQNIADRAYFLESPAIAILHAGSRKFR
jgi:hypothetical protein